MFSFSIFLSGYYVYAEASAPRASGDRARLESPRLAGSYCIQFYYHMYGPHVGQLQVFTLAGAQNINLVTKTGTQGNTWHSLQAGLRASQNYQVNVGNPLNRLACKLTFIIADNA